MTKPSISHLEINMMLMLVIFTSLTLLLNANKGNQSLMDVLRISRGTDETVLGLVFKIDEYVNLYTAEPSHFTQNLDSNHLYKSIRL